MPLIRIDVPEGVSTDIKKQIHSKVREVVLKTLAPKEVKYDYVSIREAFGYIGDGLPVIDVDLRPGRDARRKRRSRRISSRVLLISNRPSTTQLSRSRMSAGTRFPGPAAGSRALRDRKSRRPLLRRLQLKRRPRRLWSTASVRWAST